MAGELRGYRMVAYEHGRGFTSLARQLPLELAMGGWDEMPGAGIYLGTSRRFCEEFYSGCTDMDDVLLTYEYEAGDLLGGDPVQADGEVRVRCARLVAAENLSSPGSDMEAAMHAPPSLGM